MNAGHVIAVENGHQLSIELLQGLIEVACLGMPVVATSDVVHPGLFSEHAEFFAVAIVEYRNTQLFAEPVDTEGGIHGAAYDGQVFVVRHDQQIDRRPWLVSRGSCAGGRFNGQQVCM
jgi:hypothetical protein